MIEEAKFKEMLGIEGIKILKTEVNRHGALLIYVKTTTDEIHCRKPLLSGENKSSEHKDEAKRNGVSVSLEQ